MASTTQVHGLQQSRHASGGDVSSAKQVIREAAHSSDGIVRLTTQTGTLSEKAALTLLAASSDVVSSGDLFIYAAVGATPDGTPIWSELVAAIAAS